MPKFQIKPLIGTTAKMIRFGAGVGAANYFNDKDVNKPVKLVADSRFNLCAAGDEIEGFVTSVDTASMDGYSTGGYKGSTGDYVEVTFDGVQATPGTGTVAIGDYVVCGTPVARNTALVGHPKVCKATAAGNTLNFKWRIVSLGTAGTGAVGTTGVIERV